MIQTKIEHPVIYNGRKFYGIKKFDCKSISLFTEETSHGVFSTHLPISGLEYRKENPTKAKAAILCKKHWTIFHIYDDFGNLTIVEIHNTLSKEIEYAKNKAFEYDLIKN